MYRASRYRLYPNKMQKQQFLQLCGAPRFVYNELLSEQVENCQRLGVGQAGRLGLSQFDFSKRFMRLRANEGQWLEELSFSEDAAGELVFTKSGKKVRIPSNRKRRMFRCAVRAKRKAIEVIKVLARDTSRICVECDHADHSDANAEQNILSLGLNTLLTGGARMPHVPANTFYDTT